MLVNQLLLSMLVNQLLLKIHHIITKQHLGISHSLICSGHFQLFWKSDRRFAAIRDMM